jgi:hypothetical protein
MKLVTNLEKILQGSKPITLTVKGSACHPEKQDTIVLRSEVHPKAVADMKRWMKERRLFE